MKNKILIVDDRFVPHLNAFGFSHVAADGTSAVRGVLLRAASAEEDEALKCRGAVGFEHDQAPGVFMFMPGGIQTICCFKGSKSVKVQVLVDRGTAETLQGTLETFRAKSAHRPYFDFNHEEAEASAWPEKFFWQDSPAPGVYVAATWSKPGNDSVVGKTYRTFSPAFRVDNEKATPARIIGSSNCMGGLVNEPAFTNILPFWARQGAGPESVNQNQNTMKPEELAALQASIKQLETEVSVLKAKSGDAANAEVLKAKESELENARTKAENAELKAKVVSAETELKAKRSRDADAAVAAAVARGAIPAQDETLKAKWKATLEADPANEVLLASMAGNPALSGRRIVAEGNRIEVGTEDITNVLRAMGAEKNHVLRGAFYAKNVRSRLVNEWEPIMRAANSLGELAGDIVVQRSLDLLKLEFPMLSRISSDYSAEASALNQSVVTRLRAVPAVSAYNATTGYADNDATTTDVPIIINQHNSTQVVFTANDLASTRRLLFPEQEEGMHYAMGLDLVTALYALFTIGNFPNATIEALADVKRQTVVHVSKNLNKRGAYGGARTILLNSDAHGTLENDTTIVSNLINVQAGTAIGTGILPPISKMQPFEAPNLPATGNMIGFGFRADAVAMATRVPNDYTKVFPGATGGGVVTIVTNPDTGISVMLVQFIDHKLGAARMRIAWMYGVAKGQTNAAELVITS